MTEPRQVTRSAAAFSASAAGRVARQRVAQPSGWWGMALFLCAEATLFGTLIGSYFYLDFDAHRWPPAGIARPSVVLPFIATGVLLATSVPMWLAARAARAGARRKVMLLIAGALLVQLCYLALQILLFRHDLRHFLPKGSAYGSIYFTLLVAHHAHVLLGIVLDLAVLGFVAVRGLTDYWLTGVRGLALYWHVVNVLGVAVVFTVLSPSL
ncbi:MAG TPA: cytochrome c oxidase subunit 3 [Solirubrobacteraceae bacterium]|nr:cytochrome c oxidase subunit 3 [Solirubrobacteraceae bacterium]